MGFGMSQHWDDMLIWETFFKDYQPKTFIELGSGHGGMSLFFALQCYQYGAGFSTFDNRRNFDTDIGLAGLMGLTQKLYNVDIFREGKEIVEKKIGEAIHPLAVFFDNGDKRMEWKTFAHLTQKDDLCIVHDWNVEFTWDDIGNVGVKEIMMKFNTSVRSGFTTKWLLRT